MNKYKKLGTNTFLVFVGNIGPRLISFILLPLYSVWLTKEEVGVLDIIQIYSILITPYIALGLYEAMFVFPKGKNKDEQSRYFSSTIYTVGSIVILFILFLLLLPSSVKIILFPGSLYNYIPILVIYISIDTFQRIIQSFTRSLDKMKVFSITGIIYAIIMMIFSLILTPIYGLLGYWYSLIFANICSLSYNACFIKFWNYLSIKSFDKRKLKELLKYALPLIPNATMWWIINSINRPILISNVGLEGVGLYSMAGKLPSIISLLFGIFFSAFQISALDECNQPNFSVFYNKVFKIILFVQFLITLFFELVGDFIFHLLIDEKFYSSIEYMPIICCGVVVSNIATYVGITFTIHKTSKYFLYSSILAAITALIANILLIPIYGLMGACISIIISQIVMLLYRWIKSKSFVDIENKKQVFLFCIFYLASLFIYYAIDTLVLRTLLLIILMIIFVYLNRDLLNSVFLIIKSKITLGNWRSK